ncbi:MAG: UDP-N-acetylglucosamine--N-acetylmuramyl-(pentapeptide) pyrophosphoryl-undecaprenol [Acidobacteriota bacterium]|jgi:UDP-N-acetylglucosamine--N-acetylmuramyl-(pentapeptide) pyrophosphoryl-undecaprenol N-acetylglucosamine transferase|nr:UDP-N-acetylglucosamine--N-acetylmuramyl-(pentapeptide) pyrophosphoryl-undecaprenol [Acidobacteriota bacterium]
MTEAHDAMPASSTPRSPAFHALLAGGGTGGHVFPALAVAEELGRRGWRVSFTGLAGGLEERLTGERGVPFYPLPARPFLGKGLGARARSLTTLSGSGVAAARLIRRLGADVILGTGGYVSAPAVLGARLARRPILLLEPNARAGVANRWLSGFASGAAVAFRETIRDLKCPCQVTGVPVRAAFFAVPTALPPLAPLRLLVLGGSQGARQVNELVPAAVARLLGILGSGVALRVLHQAGAKNVEETRAAYASAGVAATEVEVVPFLDDVAGAMASSHLLVSRAGAITVAEICAASRAALFLPLTIAQAHQVDNARLLADAGAAELLTGEAATPDALAERLGALLGDGPRLARMGRAARGLARPGAVAAIADRLTELAERRVGR